MFRTLYSLLKSFINSPLIVFVLLILLFLSLQLISSATIESKLFGQIYYYLLVINIVTLILFLLLIFNQAWKLYRQYQQKVPGSRLTLRIVSMFVVLIFLPTTILYFFSIQFIQRSIDSWFDATVQLALKDAMNLSKSTVADKKKAYLKQVKRLVVELDFNSSTLVVLLLSDLREKSGAEEVSLFNSTGKLLASTSTDETDIVPNMPSAELLLPLQKGNDHVHVELTEGVNHAIRVLVRKKIEHANYVIVQALFLMNKRQGQMAASVQQAYTEYSELVYLRKPLKDSFLLTLSLVLLLGLLSTIWAAFVFAKRLSSPIRDLAEGTKAVGEGKYHQPIPLLDSGDLGQLVQSFNKMTRKLAKTHQQLEQSNAYSESQRAYLEGILTSLTSGVLSIDKEKNIQTINHEAKQILFIEQKSFVDPALQLICQQNHFLQPLVDRIIEFSDSKKERWNEEITIRNGAQKKILIMRGNLLPDGGCVIVLEDVTTLIKAQKEAAWGEVARRLAHEIKNPLTPIQLSAERIKHKFVAKVDGDDKATLTRLTKTIVNQVESMKEMVKAFSEYARLPALSKVQLDLDSLIIEVIDMYQAMNDLEIILQFETKNTYIEADPGKIRQILHNIIKNAIEAMEEKSDKIITLIVRRSENNPLIHILIRDNGKGIDDNILPNIFDPYVTGKSKGSGLGLAIVKKITEEHGGSIHAENIYKDSILIGTEFMISLPIIVTTT